MCFPSFSVRYILKNFAGIILFFYAANAYSQTSCDQYISSYTISQDVCNSKLVHFKNVNPSATGASWNFGDGATATGLEVSHTFNSIGEYDVKMVVEYPGGCTREVVKKIPVHITLDENLITTGDQTICPGEQVQLNSQSNNLDFCWLPADGLTDITNRNPFVKPSVTTTYRLQNQLLGENLVKNPGFENGVADFFSEYEARQITNFGEAQYWVTTNPQAWHSGFQPCGDHTSGTGNMMVVNGSPGINVVVWSQKVNVIPNTIYSFSLWITSVNPAAPAKLRFQINGNVLNQEVNAGDLACQWIQVYALWNSGTSTQAEITVINDNIIASGNDYALDDISFSTQSISYDEVTITVSPDAIIAGDDVLICEGA